MTDDQDVGSLQPVAGMPAFQSDCSPQPTSAMPCLESLVAARGVTFSRHATAFPACCPSRAAYLSGQYGHNNGVGAIGEYDDLDKDQVVPVWLQAAGYRTAYVGKYQGPLFFGWGHADHPSGVPKGWDRFWGLVSPREQSYYNYVIDDNGVPVFYGAREDDYQTDVITKIATTFVESQEAADDTPFFLNVGYSAPHWAYTAEERVPPESPAVLDNPQRPFEFEYNEPPPPPAPRHQDELASFLEAGIEVPRSAAFNEADVSDKPVEIQNRRPMNDAEIARIDRNYAHRLASLLAVDEGIRDLTDALEGAGELDNTYFIVTSDNGWLQGQHRLLPTKVHHYEESSLVPLIISGPSLARAATVREPTNNVDLAPTILDLADAQPGDGYELDGMSLVPYLSKPSSRVDRVVFYETEYEENRMGGKYVGARVGDWKYIEHGTGQRELYNLRADPDEVTSLHADESLRPVIDDLSLLIDRFKTCHGQAGENPCLVTGFRPPWATSRP